MNNISFKALLSRSGLNQTALAEKLNIGANGLSRRVSGQMDWRWQEVCTICNMLGITFDEFTAYYPAAPVKQSPAPKPKTDREQLADALRLVSDIMKGQGNGI